MLPDVPTDGYHEYCHPNGNLKCAGPYFQDQMDGGWTFWHANGQKKSTGAYSADVLIGPWLAWQEQLKQALADFKLVTGTTTDLKLMARAKGKIYEYENLSVGCEALEISGTDLDGVSFKLSDYRGKIVFLDFWGNW